MINKLKSLNSNDRHKKEIIINIEPLETRVAILEKGKLDNFHIERQEDRRIVGSVFKGKIQNLIKKTQSVALLRCVAIGATALSGPSPDAEDINRSCSGGNVSHS